LRELVAYLRQLKDADGATYKQLADRTGPKPHSCGASTLSQADTGAQLSPLKTVEAYARAAGNPADQGAQQPRVRRARELWTAAAIEQARPLAAGRGRRMQQVRTQDHLAQSLRRQRARAGQPSYRAIEQATAADGHRLPRSTCQLILTGGLLPTREQLTVLLAAFDVPDNAPWHAARDRIVTRRRPASPPRTTGYVCTDGDPDIRDLIERRERDEEIKRMTGQLREDEDYDGWPSGRTARRHRSWDLDDEEIAALEREAEAAARRAGHAPGQLRAELEAIAARVRPA
jgi:transcriptional regulator with XRE-family HTH domain